MVYSKSVKPTLTIAPKPKSFKQDSIDLLLATKSELDALKLRVDEARINPITDSGRGPPGPGRLPPLILA